MYAFRPGAAIKSVLVVLASPKKNVLHEFLRQNATFFDSQQNLRNSTEHV